jgi:hypothetical protein
MDSVVSRSLPLAAVMSARGAVVLGAVFTAESKNDVGATSQIPAPRRLRYLQLDTLRLLDQESAGQEEVIG